MQDLPLDRLGPFPVLQFAGAFLVLAALGISVWLGFRKKAQPIWPDIPAEQRYYFDGPIGVALRMLKDQIDQMKRIVSIIEPAGEDRRNQTRLLEEILDEMREMNRRR